jgi:hypothetical protein
MEVHFSVGKVSDERFGYLRQLPHLEAIHFYETWEGTDSFLSRIAGMESITTLSFSKTGLTVEGVRAVASFPNLKWLHIDHFWKDTSLEALRGHKRLETLVLVEMPITQERIEVMASLPRLREVYIERDDVPSDADIQNLQKALPNVKIVSD